MRWKLFLAFDTSSGLKLELRITQRNTTAQNANSVAVTIIINYFKRPLIIYANFGLQNQTLSLKTSLVSIRVPHLCSWSGSIFPRDTEMAFSKATESPTIQKRLIKQSNIKPLIAPDHQRHFRTWRNTLGTSLKWPGSLAKDWVLALRDR